MLIHQSLTYCQCSKYFVEQIKNGNDYLKEQREEYVDNFIKEQSGSADRILNVLKEYYQNNR